jgi:hypothetical protein
MIIQQPFESPKPLKERLFNPTTSEEHIQLGSFGIERSIVPNQVTLSLQMQLISM